MLKAVPEVRSDDAPNWKRYLSGLWLSGLRRAESLILSWEYDAPISVDLTGRHPRFCIWAEGQKRNEDEMLPMTPDFAEWLLRTPEDERTGLVFPLPVNADAAGRVVSKIGRKAKVVVDKAAGKFATTHDLRRSFGTRWASRVKPATLQKLMRHADIKTTMEFYVDQDADDIADELWRTHSSKDQNQPKLADSGNTSGNIHASAQN
jgi:integrase